MEKIIRRTQYEKHGLSYSAIGKVWRDMKSRCYTKNNKSFHNYGGRGIFVCKEWKDSLISFHNDMCETYKKGLELDRIDNNGSYCKENCRWVTRSKNGSNRRSFGAFLKGTKKIGNKFSASIKVNQKHYHIGMFNTENEAHNEYLKIHMEWYGN